AAGCEDVAAGLAIVLAEEGQRTLLVDADLRRPALHRLFACPPAPGLAELLGGAAGPPALTQGQPSLAVLPAGDGGARAAELYGPAQVRRVVALLDEGHDQVIYYISAQADAADVLRFTPHVGAAVLLVRAGLDTARELQRLKINLEQRQVQVLGFAMLSG
ncbi:MAG: CpsD/CapB family tyrosine-protein kinase, partial [Chloroflexales bacterium]|nr:CpsD/CapB family tyrosine-protein kinase [Chloroflexales bacterium]